MKVDVSKGKMIVGYNPNGNRKQRRYKSQGMKGTNRTSLAERLRNFKNHEHHDHCCCGHHHEVIEHNADHE